MNERLKQLINQSPISHYDACVILKDADIKLLTREEAVAAFCSEAFRPNAYDPNYLKSYFKIIKVSIEQVFQDNRQLNRLHYSTIGSALLDTPYRNELESNLRAVLEDETSRRDAEVLYPLNAPKRRVPQLFNMGYFEDSTGRQEITMRCAEVPVFEDSGLKGRINGQWQTDPVEVRLAHLFNCLIMERDAPSSISSTSMTTAPKASSSSSSQ